MRWPAGWWMIWRVTTFLAPVGVSVQAYVDDVLSKIARDEVLARGGKMVARFSPFTDSDLENLGLEHYFGRDAKRRLWEIEALGPLIEIYSLR